VTGVQRFIPYLVYADAPAAIDFLCRAFGFVERARHRMPDGKIGHAELGLDDQRLMLASVYPGFGDTPLHLPTVHSFVYCLVDDIDAHFARARDAGATIVGDVEEQHDERAYRALDPEGHRWFFAAAAPGSS
jgi:uncharacterized glyoxalase superfamily protein PhnB